MKAKQINHLIAAAAVLFVGVAFSDDAVPTVSSVTMQQGPGSRLVTITYQLSDAPAVVTLDVKTNATANAAADAPGWTSIGGEHIWNATGDVWQKVGASLTSGGTFSGTITWRPDESWAGEDGKGFKVDNARVDVTAWPLYNTPDYMVVDISDTAQPNTQRFYPAVDFLPGSLLGQEGAVTNNAAYKQSLLVMRKIMAKGVTWTMGSTAIETDRESSKEKTFQVSLGDNYYIGIFEVTQLQFAQVATNSASVAFFKAANGMRPMERISYDEIRDTHGATINDTTAAGKAVTADSAFYYPANPSGDSFLGLLRLKTGMAFDLPSEAQWEFAARAGHGSGYWNEGSSIAGGSPDGNLNGLARYGDTSNPVTVSETETLPEEGGTAVVGSYKPSSWGLYDMHGNVNEWCLDWYKVDVSADGGAVNVTVPSNEARVMRGGAWNEAAKACRPANRAGQSPTGRRSNKVGFRLVCPVGIE